MSIGIIGGSDGPTSIFLAENTGPVWLNTYGLVIVILMLLPNLIYAAKFKGVENQCKNKAMNMIEQIGRYASMFFMIFNIGIAELGFSSVRAVLVYLLSNIILMIVYWIVWMLYFKKITVLKSTALALIPTIIFLLSGITSRHYLLILSAVLFGIGHVYISYYNSKYSLH